MIERKLLLFADADLFHLANWLATRHAYIAISSAGFGRRQLVGMGGSLEEFEWHLSHLNEVTVYGRDGEGNVVPVVQGGNVSRN